MNKQAKLAALETAIESQGATFPVDWTTEDQGDSILLVGRWPADQDEYWDADAAWKQYGGDAILARAMVEFTRAGTDNPDDGYLYSWVTIECDIDEEDEA